MPLPAPLDPLSSSACISDFAQCCLCSIESNSAWQPCRFSDVIPILRAGTPNAVCATATEISSAVLHGPSGKPTDTSSGCDWADHIDLVILFFGNLKKKKKKAFEDFFQSKILRPLPALPPSKIFF